MPAEESAEGVVLSDMSGSCVTLTARPGVFLLFVAFNGCVNDFPQGEVAQREPMTVEVGQIWLLKCHVKCDSSCFFLRTDLAHPCQSVPIDSAPRASQSKKRGALPCATELGDAIGFRASRQNFVARFSHSEKNIKKPWRQPQTYFSKFEHLGLFWDLHA